MEQSTLEHAADEYQKINNWWRGPLNEQRQAGKLINESFKAGAGWQKEQFKRLIELSKEAAIIAGTEGFADLSEEINTICEQLQD